MEWINRFFLAAEILGPFAFAAAGAMIAIERELDMFGVLFLGITSAVGGGMVRDLMLGVTPPTAFRNPLYVSVAAPVALAVFLFAWLNQRQYRRRYRLMDMIVNALDAVGLGVFSVIGVEAAMALGHSDNLFLMVFMGMTTGIGGGVLRDVFSQTVPAVLKKRIYAVASLLGAGLYYILLSLPAPPVTSAVISCVFIFSLRMLATFFGWNLPRVRTK